MEFALGKLSLLQQEIICFISYTLCVSRREWLTCFQWAASLFVSLSVQLQACACACNTCTLAFCLVNRFIVVVKISCGCYVFVIFLFFLSLSLHFLALLLVALFFLLAYQFRSHSKGFVTHFFSLWIFCSALAISPSPHLKRQKCCN